MTTRTIAVFGAGGGLGTALIQHLLQQPSESNTRILAVSHSAQPNVLNVPRIEWHSVPAYLLENQPNPEFVPQLEALCQKWQQQGVVLHGVVSTLGWLHRSNWQPERRIEQLNERQLMAYFHGNAVLPALLVQAVKPLLAKKETAFVAQLGAKVGSIGDNALGGWYGYRASKAALNMLFKTAAIELKRTHKQLTLSVIHPGTTDTALSEPFQERLPKDKLYSPEQSAERIWSVIRALEPAQSGGFWFWDGTPLPW
ncbi:SDR family NAD(P)-dependent oxidoreductase [Aliidiomarina celeris]|uniref:SDR family NAD(P)-dependent oxidoreductase n=1 Tax=Aliidiomarina celeris TaxID=2249428 RepID=UPI000DE874EC|nr:SDR family NAD(P)-dependent oxidoreductase [Aliidiomarina celeris]